MTEEEKRQKYEDDLNKRIADFRSGMTDEEYREIVEETFTPEFNSVLDRKCKEARGE